MEKKEKEKEKEMEMERPGLGRRMKSRQGGERHALLPDGMEKKEMEMERPGLGRRGGPSAC